MYYKYLVRNVARKHGKTATFMPKPWLSVVSEHFIKNHLVRVNNWEIHPVLRLEFCTTGDTCKAKT